MTAGEMAYSVDCSVICPSTKMFCCLKLGRFYWAVGDGFTYTLAISTGRLKIGLSLVATFDSSIGVAFFSSKIFLLSLCFSSFAYFFLSTGLPSLERYS